jgi:hypothetical protein
MFGHLGIIANLIITWLLARLFFMLIVAKLAIIAAPKIACYFGNGHHFGYGRFKQPVNFCSYKGKNP